MFAASLDESSQVSFEHAKPYQLILIEAYRALFGEKTCEKNSVSHIASQLRHEKSPFIERDSAFSSGIAGHLGTEGNEPLKNALNKLPPTAPTKARTAARIGIHHLLSERSATALS
jgi:hypothetical protein